MPWRRTLFLFTFIGCLVIVKTTHIRIYFGLQLDRKILIRRHCRNNDNLLCTFCQQQLIQFLSFGNEKVNKVQLQLFAKHDTSWKSTDIGQEDGEGEIFRAYARMKNYVKFFFYKQSIILSTYITTHGTRKLETLTRARKLNLSIFRKFWQKRKNNKREKLSAVL